MIKCIKRVLNLKNSVLYSPSRQHSIANKTMKENQKIMTSKTSGSRKLKRKTLPKFNNTIYSTISSGNLIVYSVHYLIEQKIEVRLEDIVFACFLLFPQKFALKKYPRWPDSAVISRRLSDCRSKGYIAANTDLGIKLTAKGSRLAEKVARVLGVSTAKRMEKVPPSKPKERAVTPAKEVKSAINKEKITGLAKVAQVSSSQPKMHAATPTKKTKIVRKKKTTSLAPMKKTQPSAPNVNAAIAQPVQREKVIQPVPTRKVQRSRPKVFPATQIKKTQSLPTKKIIPFRPLKKARPVQPVTPAPPKKRRDNLAGGAMEARPATDTKNIRSTWPPKTKPPQPVVQPRKVEKTKFTQFKKAILPAQSNVPKEVKIRAGKFVQAMETSDAYKHYKKNGKNTRIGEFDFRSLLLCTMESSPETLARNLGLFKGYAGIHHRQDLIAFLILCEDKFSYLLKPQNKPERKVKK